MSKERYCFLKTIFRMAMSSPFCIAGFNIYSLDDARSMVKGAESISAPIMLMVNKPAIAEMSVGEWSEMIRMIARYSTVPVIAHLDHTTDFSVLEAACRAGFDSVMFDGSQLPIEENVKISKELKAIGGEAGVLVEAEIGAVGYSAESGVENYNAALTDIRDAVHFWEETRVDLMAISIGNVHRMETKGANLEYELLSQIGHNTDVPLVLHGTSGISDSDLEKLSKTKISKVNIGTSLRIAFGNTLRESYENMPLVYDRYKLFSEALQAVSNETVRYLKLLGLETFQNTTKG